MRLGKLKELRFLEVSVSEFRRGVGAGEPFLELSRQF